MAKLYKTDTTISLDEVKRVLDRGQRLMADLAIDAAYKKLYGLYDDLTCIRRLLYLYLYAIDSWVTCEDGNNYFTQCQLMDMLSEVEQLFIICRQKPIHSQTT